MRRRRGFTIIELFFVLLISAVLIGVLYQIFYSQTFTAQKLTQKNEAMASAMVASEVLQKDLRRLVTVPLRHKDDGTPDRRYGDYTAPVKITANGRHISFYIPDESANTSSTGSTRPCVTVSYFLEPARKAGTYYLKRSELSEAVPDDTSPSDMPGKRIKGALLHNIHFRLLDPKAPSAIYRSPDSNYYLEAIIEGTDATTKSTHTAPLLVSLEYPSVMQATPNIQEVITYEAAAPLFTPEEEFKLTPEEKAALDDINDLTDRFYRGDIPPAEFEDKIRDLINKHQGKPSGPIIGATGGQVPLVGQLKLAGLPKPGEPVVMSSPGGTNVVVPPPSGNGSDPPVIVDTDDGGWWFRGTSTAIINGKVVYQNKKTMDGSGPISDQTLSSLGHDYIHREDSYMQSLVDKQMGNP